jgi:hypothetical protein
VDLLLSRSTQGLKVHQAWGTGKCGGPARPVRQVARESGLLDCGVSVRSAQEPSFEPAVKRRPRGSKQDGHALWRCSSSVHDRALSRRKKATRGPFVFSSAVFNSAATSPHSWAT